MDDTAKLGFLSNLSSADRTELFQFIDQHMRDSLRTNAFLNRLAVESSRSEAVNQTLASITAKTGATPEDALLMALSLYEVAIDALGQDQRLILVDKNYGFVREVTGLLERSPEAPQHEKVAG